MRFLSRGVLPVLLVVSAIAQAHADDNWTRFRGPGGHGISSAAFPTKWTAAEYDWQVAIEGRGHSSPVTWGETVFVTSGRDDGTRLVTAINLADGSQRWQKTIDLPASHLHSKNSPASGSPAVDADRVYVPISNADQFLVVAFSHDGEEVWRHDFGGYESQHGPGSSPIVVDDLIVIACDQIGPSRVAALDAKTGEPRWMTDRASRRAAYATPMPIPGHEDTLLCLSGAEGVAGVRATDGRKVFVTGEMPMRVVASPTFITPPTFPNGAVLITCGSGGSGKLMKCWALTPPGKRPDGSEANKWTLEAAWERTQTIPYVPTPIEHDGLLFLWNDNGVVCCVDPATGKDIWKKRVGGKFTGSPILAGGHLYCMDENGRVAVVAAGPKPVVSDGGPVPDGSHATPAVAGNRLLLRSFGHLSALRTKAEF